MTGVVVAVAVLALVVAVLALLVALGTAARTRRGGAAGAGPDLAHGGSVALADLLPTVGAAVPALPPGVAGTAEPPRRYSAAFVSTACEACRDSLPTLSQPSTGSFRVAVVLDDSRDPADLSTFRTALAGHDLVLVEDLERPLSKAFAVATYPAFVGVEDDHVAVSSHSPADLVQWERA